MRKSIKMLVVHLWLPAPENFTGKVLVNVEKGIAINGFPLRQMSLLVPSIALLNVAA